MSCEILTLCKRFFCRIAGAQGKFQIRSSIHVFWIRRHKTSFLSTAQRFVHPACRLVLIQSVSFSLKIATFPDILFHLHQGRPRHIAKIGLKLTYILIAKEREFGTSGLPISANNLLAVLLSLHISPRPRADWLLFRGNLGTLGWRSSRDLHHYELPPLFLGWQ